jgi:2-polyprenyl-3-methyl-5-hydroxy-6-metoxy-1,4-benzoquinol methylase
VATIKSTTSPDYYREASYEFNINDPYANAKYRVILRWLPAQPNLRVLNAGCGPGVMTSLLAQHDPSWQIQAIDVDEEAIALSEQMQRELQLPNVEIKRESIEEHHSSAPYDLIISNDVLEHIEDDEYAIAALANLLKPGGMLCVSVPALQWLFGHHDELLGHYRRYNRRLLTGRLAPHFTLRYSRYFGALLVPIALWYSRLLWKSYPLKTQVNKKSLSTRIVAQILQFEERVQLPLGTSLLVCALRSKH